MTTDLEKQFFDAFGIEPKYEDACRLADEYWQDEELANEYGTFDYFMGFSGCTEKESGCTDECIHAYCKTIYPQITDRKLLELIFIIVKYITYLDTIEEFKTIDELKTSILEEVLYQHKQHNRYEVDNRIKHQVQALFKE